MKNLILLVALFLATACSESQKDESVKKENPQEVKETMGSILMTPEDQLTSEQLQLKDMLKLVIIDHLKIDTINKSASLTLTKEECDKMGFANGFYEYINKELEETLHAVDSMGVWKEWSDTFLKLQTVKDKKIN